MALTAIGGLLTYPPIPWNAANGIGVSSGLYVLDAAAEKAAIIAQAAEDITIQYVCFRTATVTTGATIDLRVETVDLATGFPSGTLFATDTNVAHVLGNTDDNLWVTSAALTANATITKGQWFAIVVANAGAGNFNLASFYDAQDVTPYGALYTTSYAKQAIRPSIAAKTSGGSFVNMGAHYIPAVSVDEENINSGTTPDEVGNVITLPFPARCIGAVVWLSIAAGIAYDIVLYDTDGTTVLASTAFDSDLLLSANSGPVTFIWDDAAVTLAASSQYRLVVKPTSASNVTVSSYVLGEVGVFDVIVGGQNVHKTERTNAGAWSQTTTRRNVMGLLLDQLDDGAGGAGGGLLTHPGMSGGLRG
jgi:hypothetical protein